MLTFFLHQLLCLLALSIPVHPHVPKAIVVGGAAGNVTVTYFTIPFNAEHLAGLTPGFTWHLGYASLDTKVPLACDATSIPPANYKLDVRRGASADDWSLVLTPFDLYTAKMKLARARSDDQKLSLGTTVTQLTEELKAKNVPTEIVVPTKAFQQEKDEHLAMSVVHRGFTSVRRGSVEPAGGVEFTMQFSFGDLHRKLDVKETFTAAAKTDESPKK